MNYIERKDPHTGETFQARRRNQIFAVSKNRIDYNNQKAALIREERQKLDRALRKNFIVLKEVVGNEKEVTCHRMFLLGRGFSFSVSTHAAEYNGEPRWSVYSFAWIPLPNDQIKIIKL